MKISVNDQEIYTLSDTQKKVIHADIDEDRFDADMKRRLHWVLNHKYERCLERMKAEWMPKLKQRVDAVPTNDDAFAELVFSQPDYKSRKRRDAEELANNRR
jgi:hypothetical protein